MAVFRVKKNKEYTTMSNYHLKDKNISLKAKGLLSEMLSLPDDWGYSIEGLSSINLESPKSIKTILGELKAHNYLVITKLMPNETESGRIEYVYDIYENPKTRVPKQEGCFQEVEKQEVVFYRLLNTNIQNTNIQNTKTKEEIYKEVFEKVWEMYPNKKGKNDSYKKFVKALKDGVALEDITKGIENYVKYIEAEKIEPKYIKNGSTWFNQRCWEDDYTIRRKPTTKDLASKMDFTDFLNEGRKK